MSLTVDSVLTQEDAQARLSFERYRIQAVSETHARDPDTIVGVVSDYINTVHILKPEHIFDPIERRDTRAIAIGITEELEKVIQPMGRKQLPPHSGEVYGVFVEYINDEHATMMKEKLGTSMIPRALTMTLAHFLLGGVSITENPEG